jgi:hypothetical protein
MKITGKELRKLGFEKQIEPPTLDPEDRGYHYYTYDVTKKCLLISCSNDERVKGGYSVEFYEIFNTKISNLSDLKKLIKIIKRAEND